MNKDTLLKNWGYKLAALLFAMVMWVFVLSDPATERSKNVENVPIVFSGENAMNNERGFVITGNREQLLKAVDAVVSVNTGNYSNVRADNIRAVVDLSNVVTTGIHTLRITASTATGAKIKSISPTVMKVEVDELSERTIPIQPQFLGAITEGYWNSAVEFNPASISLKGPLKELERISKAICYIPLNGVTKSYNDSLLVTLVDSNGEIVDTANFITSLPSVNVKMQVLPKKSVMLDIEGALKGIEHMAPGFSIVSVEANPSIVDIAAPADTLDDIDMLAVDSVNLNNAKESIIALSSIRKPYSDVIILTYDSTEIYVEVVEDTVANSIESQKVSVLNGDKQFTFEIKPERVSLHLKGTESEMGLIASDERSIYVDASIISEPGEYTLPVIYNKPKGAEGASVTAEPTHVTVTASKKK